MRKAKHAAFWIFDVFAEDDASRIFFETSAQCFVYGVTDAVFPWRQDLFINPLRRFRDIREKLIRRRILGLLCIAVLPADTFLYFRIDLYKFLGGDYTFLDQLIFPAFQWIAFLEFP